MKLFCFPRSPYTKKILVAAYEKGEPFEDRELVPPFDVEAMKRLRLEQPLATVPLLELDDGRYLGDSTIIVEYLDLVRPEPRMVPADPSAALEVRALDRFADLIVTPVNHLLWGRRAPSPNAAKLAASLESLHTALGILDAQIGARAFVFGDALSLADLGASAGLETYQRYVGVERFEERFPNVHRWYAALVARPSWQRVMREIEAIPAPI